MKRKCLQFGILIFLIVTPLTKGSILLYEDFKDDFRAGRACPNTVAADKSTAFTSINNHIWRDFMGYVCMRDRDWNQEGGENGGPNPNDPVRLDICGGLGGYITFRFPYSAPNLHIEFDVLAYGNDAGHLFKYVSKDGMDWTKVGDSNDASGAYNLLAEGANETYFSLQAGTTGGVYEGLHIGNLKVVEGFVSDPVDDGVIPPPFPPAGMPAPEPTTILLLGLGGVAMVRRRKR